MMSRRDSFQAIADPTRREIIKMLIRETMNVNAIADKFNASRQAISLHIKILDECGVIDISKNGRDRLCTIRPDALNEVSTWVAQYHKAWMGRIDRLEKYLNKIQRKKNAKK